MQTTLKFTIAGMHCGSCVRRVTAALESLPGVKIESVEVGSAQIAYDSERATPQEIIASVNRIGFQAGTQ